MITDDALLMEKATLGTPKSITILETKGNYQIIEKKFLEGVNYYFQYNKSKEKFIFLTCNSDCNEKLELFSFSNDTNAFAFLTKNSSRIKTKNRLILYKISNNEPIELLDTVKEVYKTFRFEKDKFIYVLENGVEKSIDLN